MVSDSSGDSTTSTLFGAAIAGVVAVVALTGLTLLGVESSTTRAIVAVILGVVAAQLLERI